MLQRALDGLEGGAGDLDVAGGRIELLVAQEHLDHADIDLLLQQVGGEAVPQAVRRDPLVDPGRLPGAIEGTARRADCVYPSWVCSCFEVRFGNPKSQHRTDPARYTAVRAACPLKIPHSGFVGCPKLCKIRF